MRNRGIRRRRERRHARYRDEWPELMRDDETPTPHDAPRQSAPPGG